MRLDEFLVKNGYCESRNIAKQLIEKGKVIVDQKICNKPSFNVSNQEVKITENLRYVSRAGYKLETAINAWKIDINNCIVLDVGASTGGFTDCCLQNGAKKIYAVDVGNNQLHHSLRTNDKVINLENINIKNIDVKVIDEVIDLIVSDISFISSKFMFESLSRLNIKSGANIITLIKPQFELSPQILNKNKGKIVHKKDHDLAIENVKTYAINYNCKIIDIIESPIKGAKKENTEFLMWCKYEK